MTASNLETSFWEGGGLGEEGGGIKLVPKNQLGRLLRKGRENLRNDLG